MIKPALQQLLVTYLKIMDSIDSKDLVDSLRKIVDVYQEEITPYSIEVALKLQENYIKLVQSKEEREDTEIMCTAHGCLQAINRILFFSIDNPASKDLFPVLERNLF